MPDEDDPLDIEALATGPKRATGDSGSIEEHSVADRILAANYLKSAQAKKGFRLFKIRPGGA